MRRLFVVLAGLLATLILDTGAAAAPLTTVPACVPGRPFLVAADARAQVYRRALPGFRQGLFGCVYGKHRPVALGYQFEPPPATGGGVGNRRFALSGTMVAYEEASEPGAPTGELLEATASWIVVVRNLLTGRVVHVTPTGPTDAPPVFGRRTMPWLGVGPLEHLVLTSDGSAAWIAMDYYRDSDGPCCEYAQVHAVDHTGTRQLAAGPGIVTSSLALVGHSVYWTEGRRSRRARLR
jgi:hypothetical protein